MITVNTKKAVVLLTKVLKAGLVPMLTGSPGLGKSTIIDSIGKENKLLLIDLRLAQMAPEDLVGLPYFNADHTKSDFIPPAYFPLEGDEIPEGYNGWLILFDELSSAPQSIQAASYKIILDRMVGQHKLHKKVAMVAAGNKATDKAITHRMSTALQARMVHLELNIDPEAWLNWAMVNDIDYRIMAYIGFKPSALFQFKPGHDDCTFACPRTWDFLSKIIKHEPVLDHELLPLLTGTISEGAGREFNAYCQIFEELPSLSELIRTGGTYPVPKEPSTLYAITSMIASNVIKGNIDDLMKFINRIPIEFQIIMLQQSLKKNMSLMQAKSIKKWISENSMDLFD